MISIKTMLVALFGFNMFALVFLGLSQYNSQPYNRKAILQEIFTEIPEISEIQEVQEEEAPKSKRVFFREEPEPEIDDDEIVEINPEFASEDPATKDVDSLPENPDQLPEDFPVEVPVEERESPYRFTDPAIALALLQQLDVFEEVGSQEVKGANYSSVAGGFKPNFDYCDEHRAFIVENPEVVFEGKNVISNYWHWHKFRSQVIDSMGASDLHREIHLWHGPKDYRYDMKLDANVFFMFNLFFYKRQVGKQFSCLTQESNHIPGHEKMYRKDKVGQALVEYAKSYEDRPQCFNYEKWFPKTWVLQDKEQCLDFFEEFLSPRYQELKAERNMVYFRKIGAGVHEGKGVFPVNDDEEVYIQKLYKNGSLCGKVNHNNLIQYNVHNLLLVKNRKFGFRSFLLVASTNPLIAYYHDGYARLSLNEYDPKSSERKTFVTNIGVNLKEASKGTEFEKLTPQEIQDRTCWFMEDFQNHLLEIGRVNDTNYLNNTLKPEFKKVMIHLLRMAQDGFFKKSSLFEIYGLDFVMDEDLKLWFIEANTMPLVDGFTKNSTVMLNRMLSDTFEIVQGLLRSRMKRIVTYINLLTKEVTPNNAALDDLDQRREEFRQVTMNHFEPEFEISSENTYERIIYEKEEGTQRYQGLIPKECL